MPYQVRIEVSAVLDGVEQYLDELAARLPASSERAYGMIKDPLLAALQTYPEPPDYAVGQFPWHSDKQRRKVLSLLRAQAIARGDYIEGPRGGKQITNLRYQRTGEFGQAWEIVHEARQDVAILTVRNTARNRGGTFFAQFVVGTLSQRSVREAAEPQQRFHAPRWGLAVVIVNQYRDIYEDAIRADLVAQFREAVTVNAKRRSRRQ